MSQDQSVFVNDCFPRLKLANYLIPRYQSLHIAVYTVGAMTASYSKRFPLPGTSGVEAELHLVHASEPLVRRTVIECQTNNSRRNAPSSYFEVLRPKQKTK